MSSQSGSIQQDIDQASTDLLLTATAVRNRRGRIIEVNLTSQVLAVSPDSGTPTGTVTDFVGSRQLATQPLGNAIAVLTLKPKQALNETFFVMYRGDAHFLPSTSSKVRITNRALTALARPFTAFFTHGRPQNPPVRPSHPEPSRTVAFHLIGHRRSG